LIEVCTLLSRTIVLNSDGTDDGSAYAGQAAVYLARRRVNDGTNALAAGVHCPVVLTRSTPNSIDDCAGRALYGTSRVRGSTLISLRLMVVNTNIPNSS